MTELDHPDVIAEHVVFSRESWGMGLFNKIDGDHLEGPGDPQVYDRARFEGARAT